MQNLEPLSSYLYSGASELVAGVGKTVGFEVDSEKKQAVVPEVVRKMIEEKFESKEKSRKQKIDALNLEHSKKPSASLEKRYAEKMSQIKVGKFKEI